LVTRPRDPIRALRSTSPQESVKKMRAGIDFKSVMEAVSRRPEGIEVEEKSAWVKISAPNGNKIYVSKRGIVRQIDLSGWGEGLPGTVPPQRDNGRVTAQLDLDKPDAVQRFEELLSEMLSAPSLPQTQGVHESERIETQDETAARSVAAPKRDIAAQIQPLPSRRARGTTPPNERVETARPQAPQQRQTTPARPSVQVRKPQQPSRG
jgi:hypothetical protein